MLEKYKGLGKLRGFLIYTLCDETFSISSSIEPPDCINKKYFYFSISLLNYLYWVFGTFLGGVLGGFLSFNTQGLDFVLTALFLVLFLEQMENKKNRIPGIIGISCTAVSLWLFGAENFIIPSMALIVFVFLLRRKRVCA